jgi:hypothetical protein
VRGKPGATLAAVTELDARRALLALIIARGGSFVLAGNREHYAELRWNGSGFTHVCGDPMGGDPDVHEIDLEDGLDRILARIRELRGEYGPGPALDPAVALSWLRD